MKLTFSPALGQTTSVKVAPVPSNISDRASYTHTILFKATFDSSQSFIRAQSDKFRVELWTNLPVHGHGRHGGEWRAVQFTELEQIQETSASAQSFSLLNEAEGKREENTLYLRLRASVQNLGGRYAYTFRLVHASGHVEWLGSHGNNGTIIVEQGISGVSLSNDWVVRKDGRFALGASLAEGAVMRLDEPEEWSGWGWKPSSLPTQFSGTGPWEGRAMVLLPRVPINLGDALRPLILIADESSNLRLTGDGDILVHSINSGSRRITLGTLERSQDLLEEATALCGGMVHSFDSTSAVVATRQPDATIPYHVVVLPVAEALTTHSVSLKTLQFMSTQVSGEQGLVLFSPKLRRAKVLNASPSDDGGLLYFGPSGGELTVSPVHVVCENDRVWQVTLLAPSKQTAIRTEQPAPQAPPTPPPSPPTLATPGLEDVLRANQFSTETSRDDITRPAPPPVMPSSNGGGARHSPRRRRASSALVRSLPARLVRAYLHAIFNVVFWFWSAFFRAFAARLVGEAIPQVVTRLLGFALSNTAPRSPSTREASAAADAIEPSGATRASRDVSQGTIPRPVMKPAVADATGANGGLVADSIPTPHAEPSTHIPFLPPRRSSSGTNERVVPRVVFSAALLSEGSPPSLIVRGQGPIKDLRGTLDGKPWPAPLVTALEDDVFLVEFGGLAGEGELEVSFEL